MTAGPRTHDRAGFVSGRTEVTGAGRIVVKVGSSSLTQRGRIDLERLRLLVDAI
ncbi:MAG: glutamate 5-kinase, partial [Kribbellaceae bacterium]|nr:glutamate 5-kinase [Kribbellaceae bacterium]